MKVKDLAGALSNRIAIEFRINGEYYADSKSDGLLVKDLGDYEVADWFVFGGLPHCICINLKPKDDAI